MTVGESTLFFSVRERTDVRLDGNPFDRDDCPGYFHASQTAGRETGEGTALPGSFLHAFRMDTIGPRGVFPLAHIPRTLP